MTALVYGGFRVSYYGRIFPHVSIAGVEVGGMTVAEAQDVLDQASQVFIDKHDAITVVYKDQEWELLMNKVGVVYEVGESVQAALEVGRNGVPSDQLEQQWLSVRDGVALPAVVEYDRELAFDFIATVAAQVEVPVIPPTISLLDTPEPTTQSRVRVDSGEAGLVVEVIATATRLDESLAFQDTTVVELVAREMGVPVLEEQLLQAKERAEALLGKELVVEFVNDQDKQSFAWTLGEEELVGFLGVTSEFNEEALMAYVDSIGETVDRQPQNALFQFDENSNRVEEFKPALDGLVLDRSAASELLRQGLRQLEVLEETKAVVLTPVRVQPEVTTEQVNRLGIQDLLGRGESTFYGSIPARIHNLTLAANRLNGVLVSPGEDFSYNAALGEVSSSTGFQQAYVISNGRTELGDGGGVCQDSTTLFRAVLDAGLPISEWHYHSYRVGYYEQNQEPGFDATVYAPTTDFKFTNNTPGHILVQAHVEGMSLIVELYGTDDGRVATISNYRMWDVSPPPPDLFQDDPTLPAGVVKQVDWKAWGGKTKFDYVVTKEGEAIYEKTFYSNYKPWQSVYLRGTGGV